MAAQAVSGTAQLSGTATGRTIVQNGYLHVESCNGGFFSPCIYHGTFKGGGYQYSGYITTGGPAFVQSEDFGQGSPQPDMLNGYVWADNPVSLGRLALPPGAVITAARLDYSWAGRATSISKVTYLPTTDLLGKTYWNPGNEPYGFQTDFAPVELRFINWVNVDGAARWFPLPPPSATSGSVDLVAAGIAAYIKPNSSITVGGNLQTSLKAGRYYIHHHADAQPTVHVHYWASVSLSDDLSATLTIQYTDTSTAPPPPPPGPTPDPNVHDEYPLPDSAYAICGTPAGTCGWKGELFDYPDGTLIGCDSLPSRFPHWEITSGCLYAKTVGGGGNPIYLRGWTASDAFRGLPLAYSGGRKIGWRDVAVTYRGYIWDWHPNSSAWSGLHVMARYQTENDLYVGSLRADGLATIKKKVGGVYTTLAQRYVGTPKVRAWYTLTFTTLGQTVTLSISGPNGTSQISATDTSLQWGNVGVRTDDVDVYLDDVSVGVAH